MNGPARIACRLIVLMMALTGAGQAVASPRTSHETLPSCFGPAPIVYPCDFDLAHPGALVKLGEQIPLARCAAGGSLPCVAAVRRNGVDVEPCLGSGPPVRRLCAEVGQSRFRSTDARASVVWDSIVMRASNYETNSVTTMYEPVPFDDVWEVDITASTQNWRGGGSGRFGSIGVRPNADGTFTVTMKGSPARLTPSTAACGLDCMSRPGSVAPLLAPSYLEMQLSSQPLDLADPTEFSGYSVFANTMSTGTVPSTERGRFVMFLGNTHFEPDGVTPVVGRLELTLPLRFLRYYLQIDDPSRVTPSAFDVRLADGSTTQNPATTVTIDAEGAVRIVVPDIHFSSPQLIVTGRFTPTAPRTVTVKRLSSRTARFVVSGARSRGFKITGYKVSCASTTRFKGKRHVVSRSPLRGPAFGIAGLRPGSAYDCKVFTLGRGLADPAQFRRVRITA